jgi:hypothetical protein
MNRTFFGLVDYFALMSLQRDRSLKNHFSMNQITSIDFIDFYEKPSIPEIDFKSTENKNIYTYMFRRC